MKIKCESCGREFIRIKHNQRFCCPKCRTKVAGERYRQKNKEKLKEYNQKYRQKNKEKFREYTKKWCLKNPEKVKAKAKRYKDFGNEVLNQAIKHPRKFLGKYKKPKGKIGVYKKERLHEEFL